MLREKSLGDYAENQIIELLTQHGLSCQLNPEKRNYEKLKQYDIEIIIDGETYFIEVKFDLMEARTGNIAIEFYNTKKCRPSGIGLTKAHIWAIVLQKPQTIWVANTETLIKYIKDVKADKNVVGGDDNSAMLIYKREKIFADVFVQIDNLSSSELLGALYKCLSSSAKSQNIQS